MNIKAIIFLAFLLVIITIIVLYIYNKAVHEFFDENILQKEVSNEDLVAIEKSNPNNDNIYAFDNKIVILNKNSLEIYNRMRKSRKNA